MFTSHSVVRRFVVFAAFVFALSNMAVAAADDLPSFATGGYAGGIRSREVMNKIDTDGDGMISRAEWNAFQEKVFAALDARKKGSLSAKIFVSRRCERLVSFATGGYARGLCSLETSRDIDTNRDGRISHDEFMAYQGNIFDTMDTSLTHAGVLGAEEMFATGAANWH
ncbi:MAG: Calcium-binding EF-hand-containing protein [Gammaproteobacteria bacterium]|nr:Calcium-binding EF-hand-containing protein [Gammaproteobacteria bacterium]